MRAPAVFALCLSASLVTGCRTHPQDQGTYAFSWDSVIQDTCGLYPGGGPIGIGALTLAGDDVWIRFDPFALNLRGQYRDPPDSFTKANESFYVDGSADQVFAPVNGQTCQLDMVQLHFDGTTVSPTEFQGAARVTYTSLFHPECECRATGTFHAALQ